MRYWMAALGGDLRHEEDLPTCCRRTVGAARYAYDPVGCPDCGATWQTPGSLPVAWPEDCAFFDPVGSQERRGAA